MENLKDRKNDLKDNLKKNNIKSLKEIKVKLRGRN